MQCDGSYSEYNTEQIMDDCETLNIHALANKCKQWAYKNKFGSINSFPSGLNWGVTIIKDTEAIFENYVSSTEPEAIFKACEWILKEKENK